jgi:hypothetical protein
VPQHIQAKFEAYFSDDYRLEYEHQADHNWGGDATASWRMSLRQTRQADESPYHLVVGYILSELLGQDLHVLGRQIVSGHGQESGQMIRGHEIRRALLRGDFQPSFYILYILNNKIRS